MDKTALNAHLVTTRLKRGFYHLKSVVDQTCGKFLVWLPMKGMFSLILLLVRHVFRGDEFLVVLFRQARDWHRKKCGKSMGWSAGRVRVRSVRERVKFLQLQRGGFKFCECGVEADKKF